MWTKRTDERSGDVVQRWTFSLKEIGTRIAARTNQEIQLYDWDRNRKGILKGTYAATGTRLTEKTQEEVADIFIALARNAKANAICVSRVSADGTFLDDTFLFLMEVKDA